MSTNDYILNLLNIKDRNIKIISNKLENKVIKGKNYKIIEAVLSYNPEYCPLCGILNQSSEDIICWGFKRNCSVKIPPISNCKSRLILHKQRFFCKHCNKTFTASTTLVDKNKNISNNTYLQIRLELMSKQSEKDIASRVDVSVSKVDKILNEISSKTELKHQHLPKYMNFDEFKATKDTKGKMAMIIMDNKKGTIFDILDSRKSKDIEKFFTKYSRRERNTVKVISTDFYKGYIKTAKNLFRNADIVIDRFHIVIQAYNALNITRVKLCYKSNPNYNKLKAYWKLILKNEKDLTECKTYSKYFKQEISQKEIVTYLINTNDNLKATYETYQGIIDSIKNKDFPKFKNIITHQPKDITEQMRKVLKLYKENIQYIENSFKYEINNGIIEGTNNLIKTMKRIAFGYRKYSHFVARIFLIKGILKG